MFVFVICVLTLRLSSCRLHRCVVRHVVAHIFNDYLLDVFSVYYQLGVGLVLPWFMYTAK